MTIAVSDASIVETAPRPRSAIAEFVRQQPLGTVSFFIIVAMMFAGVASELVAPYDPLAIDFTSIMSAPSWTHWCGTDAYGRDICSRLIYGSRTALVIGFTSSFIGSSIGAVLGIASAYFGGRIDSWIQRVMDVLLAFPIIVLALVVVAAFGKLLVGGDRHKSDHCNRHSDRAARGAGRARRGLLRARDALCRCRTRSRLLPHSHYLPSHGAERGGALSHHADRLHRPGDPGGGLAVVPRSWRAGTDRRLGSDAVRAMRPTSTARRPG